MSRSVMQIEKKCYLCGNTVNLDEHHIFGGNQNRKNAEKYGLKVWLCGSFTTNQCHRRAHEGGQIMDFLHREGQKRFEEIHGSREEFMGIFGRNYL